MKNYHFEKREMNSEERIILDDKIKDYSRELKADLRVIYVFSFIGHLLINRDEGYSITMYFFTSLVSSLIPLMMLTPIIWLSFFLKKKKIYSDLKESQVYIAEVVFAYCMKSEDSGDICFRYWQEDAVKFLNFYLRDKTIIDTQKMQHPKFYKEMAFEEVTFSFEKGNRYSVYFSPKYQYLFAIEEIKH